MLVQTYDWMFQYIVRDLSFQLTPFNFANNKLNVGNWEVKLLNDALFPEGTSIPNVDCWMFFEPQIPNRVLVHPAR